MKKILFPFVTLILLSCAEPEKLSVYNVSINYDELNTLGSGYSVTTKTDTIHSLNDSTAYVKALMMAEARQRGIDAYSKTRLGEANVYFFFVEDSLGNNLGSKLGIVKIEEINSRLSIISEITKKKYLY
ncbi:MAG: hypothetical protein ACJLTB_19520 [Algoriphagus aquaeductus]|uniref:hypothetical protein n=1 Tax=Algoriphagus aquaeductus TaxID=475299 RepID=UPI0038798F6C